MSIPPPPRKARHLPRWAVVVAWSLGLAALPALGQYAVDAHVVAAGGGTSTGGVYSVTGTIGQSDAGPTLAGGSYAVAGGFWNLVTAIQTPGAPRLAVTLDPNGSVTVRWPSPSTGFLLQQNETLDPDSWIAADQRIADDGTTKSISLERPVGVRFFRLQR